MADVVLRIPASQRPRVEALIRSLPGILSGRVADVRGIAHGFRMRLAFTFFMLVKEAFIVKSRGGTDEAGIKWPKLSPAYLAYTRPMGVNGKGSRSPPKAGGLAPGGHDGFMTKKQLDSWRGNYAHALTALIAAGVDPAEAKGRAAASAWKKAKAAGVKTKLGVFGNREVEILRDRGILFNSLSPGALIEQSADALYSPPNEQGGEQQVVREEPTSLTVGTAVPYAGKHHFGRRPFWPVNGQLPAEWWEEMLEVAASGLLRISEFIK